MKRLLLLLFICFAPPVPAQEAAPDAMVKSITADVLNIIKKDKDIQAGNPRKIADLVETRILPHFDFARMTQIAVAVNWRKATPEQQKALIAEFKSLLVRTYSNALTLYRDQVVEFKPLHMKAGDTEVTIHSDIKQKGAQPVSLDYEMEKTANGWKVFDVKVGGVSLITNYREDFAAQVRESGIDGLIKALASKNRGAGAGKA